MRDCDCGYKKLLKEAEARYKTVRAERDKAIANHLKADKRIAELEEKVRELENKLTTLGGRQRMYLGGGGPTLLPNIEEQRARIAELEEQLKEARAIFEKMRKADCSNTECYLGSKALIEKIKEEYQRQRKINDNLEKENTKLKAEIEDLKSEAEEQSKPSHN